jgi:hypothetical protein
MMDYYMDVLQDGRCDAKVKESGRVVAMFDSMTSTSISEFEKIKNDVRRRYHQNASIQRQNSLRDRIIEYKSFVKKTSENEDFQSPNLEDVKIFATIYGEARGCQPFVYGLCEFLRMQLGKSKIYYWECNDAAITDTGVKCFASDAAKLMCATLQVQPEDASKDGTRRWHMNGKLKDSTIRKILDILPSIYKLKRSDVRPTGRRGETAFDRDVSAIQTQIEGNCCCLVS